ncbi:MAG: sigma-70 family RNA polymerase sigma factor [Proteobacteria bacterium]|nr:sigma-70 family RNA polymerase sigma factor [Pseudomonadota bacterium]HQR03392.1 sigma-70 family RNA polymerase sigma factor [Rhodocyclaceae bacterium]
MKSDASSEFERQIAILRPTLLRFAQLQLRESDSAEDAVQETLLAALATGRRFEGRSELRTWLTAILRNKIIDHLRRRMREPVQTDLRAEGDDGDFDVLFAADGHWAAAPASWGDPVKTLENRRFHDVFEACVELLPAQTARVFMMREFLGLETEEICQELVLSTSNCWVTLYRARMRLRECLQKNWFGNEPVGGSLS